MNFSIEAYALENINMDGRYKEYKDGGISEIKLKFEINESRDVQPEVEKIIYAILKIRKKLNKKI